MVEKVKFYGLISIGILLIAAVSLLSYERFAPRKPVNYNISPGPVVNAKADIVIEGPKSVKIGQLARLDVTKSSGKTYKWKAIPEGLDFEVYDDGRKVVFSSGAAGEYTFIVACANDNDVDVKVHVIVVGDGGTPPTPPGPPNPPAPASGLSGKVIEWCNLVNSPNKKAEAAKLAESFVTVQDDIRSGKLDSAEAIIEATKEANRTALGNSLALWVPCLEKLQQEMQKMAEDGTMVTTIQHATVWGEIADGLATVAK